MSDNNGIQTDETPAERSARLSRPNPQVLTVANIGPLLEPFRRQFGGIANASRDIDLLTARLNTIEYLTNHHIERLEEGIPALIGHANQATQRAKVLMEQLEDALTTQRRAQRRENERVRAINERNFIGRLRWLVTGR